MPWVDGRTAVQGKIPLWNVEGTEASRVSPGMDAWVVLGPKGGAGLCLSREGVRSTARWMGWTTRMPITLEVPGFPTAPSAHGRPPHLLHPPPWMFLSIAVLLPGCDTMCWEDSCMKGRSDSSQVLIRTLSLGPDNSALQKKGRERERERDGKGRAGKGRGEKEEKVKRPHENGAEIN